MKSVTVGITTRNRPGSLARALLSLGCAADLIAEALVFDDASDPPAERGLDRRGLSVPLRIVRDDRAPGYIVARNRLVSMASTPFVLLMDDDAAFISREAIEAAIVVMRSDPKVAAVAFAPAELDGQPWPASLRPASCDTPRVIRAFTGFAHMVRRDVFRETGGYQELFGFYGEEKEFCLRLFARGCLVVYLPDALVIHAPDPVGRDSRRYLRQVARNDCLASILTDPLPRPLWVVPGRFALYFKMRRAWRISDRGGGWWLLRDLVKVLPAALRQRQPVAREALKKWRALGRDGHPYHAPLAVG